MKPVSIDFVKSRMPARLWWFTAAMIFTISAATSGYGIKLERQNAPIKSRIAEMQKQLLESNHSADAKPAPRLASTQEAARILQTDLNTAFNTIENLEISGSSLLKFNISLQEDQVLIEYQVDQMRRVAELSSQLNDGYETRPWHLQAAVRTDSGNQSGPGTYNATWRTSLSALR